MSQPEPITVSGTARRATGGHRRAADQPGSRGANARWHRPGCEQWIDAAAALVTTMLTVTGFASTYSGRHYLMVAAVGAVLGAVLALVVNALRWSVLVTAAGALALYFLIGPALLLQRQDEGSALPTGATLRTLATLLTGGWKQLLTTLPPVAADGPMLFAPLLIALLCCTLTVSLAARSTSSWAPAIVPALALAAVVLLGTDQPAARLLQGTGLLLVALVWTSWRHRRVVRPARNNTGRAARVAVGVSMLLVAGLVAELAGPSMPGADGRRLILRTYVKPPFDLADYPSPLVGFRKYTQAAKDLYAKQLLSVTGLPAGQTLQIATMDSYDGTVWGATNATVATGPGEPIDAFSRVGERVRTGARGAQATYTVTVDNGYAGAFDLDAWVANAGVLSSIAFHGPSARALTDSFRYNLDTHSGITTPRLVAGDSYRITAVLTPSASLPSDARPYGTPTLSQAVTGFVADKATQWSGGVNSVLAQVLAVAKHLHDYGAWSDGGPGQGQFLPGHSTGRLTNFILATQPVGDDEQYAATFALMANYLGMPARVVLTATPQNGIVRGQDVHADVQLHVRSARATGWVIVPRDQYMPNRDKKPKTVPPQEIQNTNAANVPPPNPVHPPGTLDQPEQPQQNTSRLVGHKHHAGWQLPGWVGWLVRWVMIPLLLLGGLTLLILLAKRLRRRRRRIRGSPADRLACGWLDLVEHARDLGIRTPALATRQEQGQLLGQQPGWQAMTSLAALADREVFGAAEPSAEAAAGYWRQVDQVRHQMSRSAGRWRQLRAALNLHTLLPGKRSLPGRTSSTGGKPQPGRIVRPVGGG